MVAKIGDFDGDDRRHQWGAETSTQPLAIMHAKPSPTRVVRGYVAIICTVVSWLIYMITMILSLFVNNPSLTLRFVVEGVLYMTIVTTLIFSALVYLTTRQGALYRFIRHERVPRAMLDDHFAHNYDKGITVLIPSYVEQPKVVEKTIWSAALQEFPDLAVVLLIDDPPHPNNDEARAILKASRELMPKVLAELAAPAERFTKARDETVAALADQMDARRSVVARCAEDYRAAAQWLEHKADTWLVEDHTDDFFCDQVLRGLARDLRLTEQALNESITLQQHVDANRILQLYERLVRIFTAKGWSFERKLYASTSREGNKAMNLNSFIGLMGHSLKRVETSDGVILRDVREGESPDFVMRNSEYVLTLDADSMLLRDYCLRLVYQMEQPGNERVAVIQTPYSSYRGAPTRIERIAAATTDIQHMLHQGMTYYDATFWVGANAVIRKAALDDICVVSTEGTRTVKTYIQDRTVIEDTTQAFIKGEYPIYQTGTWNQGRFVKQITTFDWDAAVMPESNFAIGCAGNLLVIPERSHHKDLAAKFIDYVLSDDVQNYLGNAGGIPVAGDASKINDEKSKAMIEEYASYANDGKLSYYPDYAASNLTDAVPAEFQELVNGTKKPADVLKGIHEKYDVGVEDMGVKTN